MRHGCLENAGVHYVVGPQVLQMPIEVQGRVFRHDADADDGLRAGSFLSKPACLLPMGIIFEAPGSVSIARGDHRPFAIAEFPIQVSSEEHVPLGVGESYRCAHASLLLR